MKIPPRLIIVGGALALAVAAAALGVEIDDIKAFLGLLTEEATQ